MATVSTPSSTPEPVAPALLELEELSVALQAARLTAMPTARTLVRNFFMRTSFFYFGDACGCCMDNRSHKPEAGSPKK